MGKHLAFAANSKAGSVKQYDWCMNVQQAYNIWAGEYDTNDNKTRDIEAISLRHTLKDIFVDRCLEIGCGTGKNTIWLQAHATIITAVDLSEAMLAKAKEKITANNVEFIQADINSEWNFLKGEYDLVTFSLVLEHIENLESIFKKLHAVTKTGSIVYIGELHPFKQYTGTKARFETNGGKQIVTCFSHHISDFTEAAQANGFAIEMLKEYFDDDDKSSVPRIFVLLLKRNI